MSDDRYLGYAFRCVPRRWFIMLLGASLCIYSVLSVVYHVLFTFEFSTRNPKHGSCQGNRCFEVISCEGMIEASFHIREISLVLLGFIFGWWGYMGAANCYPDLCERFGYFLFAIAAMHLALAVFDGMYTLVCGGYPFNVIEKALLWPFPNFPVLDSVKYEMLNTFTEYPVDIVNTMTGGAHIWCLYFIETLPLVAIWSYAGQISIALSQVMCVGVFGLGANYSINSWRKQVIFKNQMKDKFKETMEVARNSANDVGWKPSKSSKSGEDGKGAKKQGRSYGSTAYTGPISIETDFKHQLDQRGIETA